MKKIKKILTPEEERMEMLLKRHSERKLKRGVESVTLIPHKLEIKGEILKLIPRKTEQMISWLTLAFGWLIPVIILSNTDITIFSNGRMNPNVGGALLFFSVLQIMSVVFMNALAHPTYIFDKAKGIFLEQGENHLYTKKLRNGKRNQIELSEIKAIQISTFDAKTGIHTKLQPHNEDSETVIKIIDIINNRLSLVLDHKIKMPILDSTNADEVMDKAFKIAEFIGVDVI